MIKTLALTAILCLSALLMNAQQKLSLENIRYVSLRNSGTIVESEELKGYFFYYISDKVDKRTNEYTIQIVDENLKEVKKITFEDSKDEQLLESSYNSASFVFLFFNKDTKILTYKIYGLDGKMKYTYTKELDKKSMKFLMATIQAGGLHEESGQNNFVYNIDNKGYVSVIPLRDGRDYSFEINVYLSDKKKQFTYAPEDEIKYSLATYLGATDSLAVFEVLKKDKLMNNKFRSSLLVIDLTNGKKAFEIASETPKYNFHPLSISALNGSSEFLVLGNYYDKGDKVVKDKTLGLAALTINSKGKIVSEKYNSWQKDFSKYLAINSKGAVEDVGYLYFHKIIQTEGGDIFAVAEGYKRVADGVGIAMSVLAAAGGGYSGNNSVTKLNITDMLLIRFNSKFDVKEVTVYEKNKNRFSVPGADYQSPQMIAAAAKMLGAYDYEFTRTDKFHTSFFVGYNDYERSKDYKGLTFHSISYDGSKVTTDKINLQSKASSLRVMPGKTGFVLITEYFKKDKRLDARMEKLN